jgi:hypothetical protein
MNLIEYIQEHHIWSQATFGGWVSPIRLIRHIEKELKEIEAAPYDLEEWVDVIILAIDGACRIGATPQEIADALYMKQDKNKTRRYVVPTDPNQPAEHDRTGD